ncbi:penicillin-binding transpeptidase domain-containing protein [Streptomyces sp. NPDC003077]|uniref:penicillin-binding transpeptidase domain-containing protein n=1 Tax=Streptomyces sp. NPDC003077 TaxID=3154443 RepID=UPI0033B06B01
MTHSRSHGDFAPPRRRRSRGRTIAATVAALAVTAGAGYWGYSTLIAGDGADDPQVVNATKELRKFLDAWQAGDGKRAGRLTDTPANAESLITSVMTNLKPSKTEITTGDGKKTEAEGEVEVPFTVKMALPGAGNYTWESKAKVRENDDRWKVEFRTEMVHPRMVPGQTLALKSHERAAILDAKGGELQATSLIGVVDTATGKGTSGLQARYDRQLTGGDGAAKSVVVVDRQSGAVVKQLTGGAAKGKPVRTTINPRVQQAAADALSEVKKNAAIVAVDPSTGNILAAANKPAGLNRALEGRYPPGSTFKVVTAAALLKKGMKPTDPAECPKFAYVDGQRFENQDQFVLPADSTFRDNFAHSCNTFFVNSRGRLSNTDLHDTAAAFGVGGTWDVGAVTYDGDVPVATSDNDKAASTIGQARVQASPLVMASIAATVKEGTFKQPVLVPEAVKKRHQATARLDTGVVESLRTMMRATVTEGAGKALRGLPGAPHAKTGTAEFGTETPPRTHAWMIGYQGDRNLAWSVLLEDGGSGGSDAGPVAAKFLRNLTR